jgi:hypothetical protein
MIGNQSKNLNKQTKEKIYLNNQDGKTIFYVMDNLINVKTS